MRFHPHPHGFKRLSSSFASVLAPPTLQSSLEAATDEEASARRCWSSDECEGVKITRKGGFELGFQKLKRSSPFVFQESLFKTYPMMIKTMQEVEIDKLFYPGSLATASYVQSTRQGDLALIPRESTNLKIVTAAPATLLADE